MFYVQTLLQAIFRGKKLIYKAIKMSLPSSCPTLLFYCFFCRNICTTLQYRTPNRAEFVPYRRIVRAVVANDVRRQCISRGYAK